MKPVFRSTFLSRRHFLKGLGALAFLPSLTNASTNTLSKRELFINGHHDQKGNYFVSTMTANGEEQLRLPLHDMPHGFAIDPVNSNRVVTFPGLTGTKMMVMDINQGKQIAETSIRKNRHFNGHGTFSPDGQLLFATENIIDTSEGVIGIYDGNTFEFIREISAHGLGPHGMRILPDGKTLVVASGGLRTHPKTGKFYTNLNDMRSAVLFIEVKTGNLIARREIPVDKLSIRNIYFAPDNQLLVTCQYYGRREMPKVVGLIQGLGEIEMLEIDDDNLWRMNNYTGGTVVVGNIAAVSCPRGNHLTFWDLKQKRFINSVKIKDVSGIQPYGNGQSFLASAETGKLYQIDSQSLKVTRLKNTWQNAKWTNHMVKTLG